MLEPARPRRPATGHPAAQLTLEVGLALGAVRWARAGPRIEAPVVRVAVPCDEGEAEDFFGYRADAVVRVALRGVERSEMSEMSERSERSLMRERRERRERRKTWEVKRKISFGSSA